MGIYTVLDDNKVDGNVAKDLKHIVESVSAMQTVRSIILGGGFGRGEGSVLVDGKGIRPVNDYDLFIVVSDDDQTDFRMLAKDLAGDIGIRLLDLIPIKHSTLSSLPPTQINYDLKYGGRHLWGENLLNMIPDYKEGHVDPASGKTLLLSRLICAIEAFSEDFERRTMSAEENFFLVTQTGKVISSCVEALLIGKKKYHYSYQRRLEIFDMEFPEKKDLNQLNKKATEFKLMPSMHPKFDSLTYWKDAVHEYISIISECFTPAAASPVKSLWKELKRNPSFTNYPIERVELMLLLHREARIFLKKLILSRARKEIKDIAKAPFPSGDWETLRERTSHLWHELYH